jgi:hypothetical protein
MFQKALERLPASSQKKVITLSKETPLFLQECRAAFNAALEDQFESKSIKYAEGLLDYRVSIRIKADAILCIKKRRLRVLLA